MNAWLRRWSWPFAKALLAVAILVGGTYAALFVKAMAAVQRKPTPSPIAVACEQLGRPQGGKIRVRFTLENQTHVEAEGPT